MKRRLAVLCSILCFSWLAAAPAWAAAPTSRADAQALVQKVIAYYKANGRDKTLAEINARGSAVTDVQHDLYVYVSDMRTGRNVAHGGNPQMVGMDFSHIRDTNGKPFVADLLQLARVNPNHSGWVDHTRPNPLTRQIENKSTYVQAWDGLAFCVAVPR